MASTSGKKPKKPAPSAEGADLDAVVPQLKKTPLFQAINAPRYQRQALIKEIEGQTGSKLVCYVAGMLAPVDREDIVCFVDLLHNVEAGASIDILLHTGGGDIDAAEKLITMVRKKVGTARLRVIVPDYAKSAGTLIALGADSVVMSDASELGPIDPQIVRTDGNGNRVRHSVKNYLDAYDEYKEQLDKNPNNATARIMMSKLDPDTVQLFKSVMDRARSFAESQLKRGMMLKSGNWSQAVSALLNTTRFQTHGQPISWEDASDPAIGLTVDYLAPDDETWMRLWQLYCLQILAVKDKQKLFESSVASVCIDSRAA